MAGHGDAAPVESPPQTGYGDLQSLPAYFLRLVPVCERLLEAATAAGEVRPEVHAYELMRAPEQIIASSVRREPH